MLAMCRLRSAVGADNSLGLVEKVNLAGKISPAEQVNPLSVASFGWVSMLSIC